MLVNKLKYVLLIAVCLSGCRDTALNDPYPDHNPKANFLYASFNERPKHLDPARSYSSNEWVITNQIYETPLQYHYLKRPYTLIPQVATQMPEITYLDAQGGRHSDLSPEKIAFTEYKISIRPNVFYQPHPAFAQKENGEFLYHQLTEDDLDRVQALSDFDKTDTRELVAADFVYQIKRLADPTLNSPVFGLMQGYIEGLDAFEQVINKKYDDLGASIENPKFLDFRGIELSGVQVVDDYTYTIKIKGSYPQFIYWLAMPFFAPMPWEAVKFYAQEGLVENNITLDWYPVGTGPYLLSENNPNQRMVLSQNPQFRKERYPIEGGPGDVEAGLLDKKGKWMPFLDKIIFTLEKESIPYWNKFLQGYYDQSGISSDSFDQALQASGEGGLELTQTLQDKSIKLNTAVLPTTYYWAFNMLDDVVGGYSEDKKALRQAISIAVNFEEYIQIFNNGRAIAAQSPLPPGIFGYKAGLDGYNPVVYEVKSGKVQRKSIDQAKALLTKAGYPAGIDPKTKAPLVLYYDATMSSGPDSQAMYAWLRKQFEKIGIELVVRATQYNRFQDKMRTGNAQIFSWGWNADYPDPENFLFLLYGPNSKVKHGGENAVNYESEKFDQLFSQMKSMANGPEREAIIAQMLRLLQDDAPWMFGFHPKLYALSHHWLQNQKPHAMGRNTLKYLSVDTKLRAESRSLWNQPIFWPLLAIISFGLLVCVPALYQYRRKILSAPKLKDKAL